MSALPLEPDAMIAPDTPTGIHRPPAVVVVTEKPPVSWREVRCRNKWCRTLLFRYRVPLVASDPARTVTVEWVCPDRRCRRAQTVELPERGDVLT